MLQDIFIEGVRLKVYHNHCFPGRPTIVFLHESLGCITLWRDFPEQLGAATQCNVLVYDRQGYGQSAPFSMQERSLDYMETEAAVLDHLLRHMDIRDAILFGHSDGGSIALIAAALYPERIRAIITEGAHIFVEAITLQGIRDADQAYATTNLKERLAKYHGDKTDAVFRAWAGTWQRPEFHSWNIEQLLPRIQCPVLVIQGDADEYGSPAQVHGISRQVSGPAQELMLPGIGHTPHRQAALQVLEYTAAWIRRYVS